ncbi:MAG: hypothetical protein ACTSP9_15165 [Promethearchaeota archaeon]
MVTGGFEQLYIKGSSGYLLIMKAGPNSVLMLSTTSEVRLRDFLFHSSGR